MQSDPLDGAAASSPAAPAARDRGPLPVSVIVATAGGAPALAAVLAEARRQAEELGGELVLAWNAAADDAQRPLDPQLARLAHRVVCEPEVGKSHALNAALRAARGSICAFLDDDGLPQSGWLRALLSRFEREGPELGGVGGRVVPIYPAEPPPWYRELLGERRSSFLGPLHDLQHDGHEYAPDDFAHLPLGANCAFRRELLLRLGYAPQLGPNRLTGLRGGEDTLLARQVLDLGYRLQYVAAAQVHHPVCVERLSPEFLLRAYRSQGVEWVRLLRALDLPEPRRWRFKLRLRLLRYAPLILLRTWMPSSFQFRRACLWQRCLGILEELRRGEEPSSLRGALPRAVGGARALTLLLALALCVACGRSEAEVRRQNLVLCVVDTLRADHLGCYGYERDTSPQLDRLAAESVRFAAAYAQAPETVASHASLFSSTYPAVHATWNDPGPLDPVRDYRALSPEAVCLAEVLQSDGYTTAAFADGGWLQVERGLGQGFETFESRFLGAEDRVDQALEWLADHDARRPFFLFLHTYEVHTPYLPAEEFLADFEPDYDGPLRQVLADARAMMADGALKNPIVEVHRKLFAPRLSTLTEADRRFLIALYDAEIRSADRALGRFFEALRAQGRLADTVLAVTADHGEEFGEHGSFEHTQVYDECLHVPLLVRLPEGPRGTVREDRVELVDVMPTLLAELGLRVPTAAQGRVLDLRAAAGDAGPRVLWAEVNAPVPQAAWRRGGDKVLLFPERPGEYRVFDLERDPSEREPLTDARAEELAASVRAQLEAWWGSSQQRRERFALEPVARGRDQFRQSQIEELEALGYR
jgi:arylsulfatase A-like enzyme/glycosyltransferase involved in cell wall biosynthesis